MSQVTTTIKIDADLKKDVQALAKNFGLSFSDIVEGKLREVRRERRIVFEDELVPNKQTAQAIKRARRDIGKRHDITGPFDSADELVKSLRE